MIGMGMMMCSLDRIRAASSAARDAVTAADAAGRVRTAVSAARGRSAAADAGARVRTLASAIRSRLHEADVAWYSAVAGSRTPAFDVALARLSSAADHSKISFTIAAALAVRPGPARRAAGLGVAAIGVASASANLVGKGLIRRRRPDRDLAGVPLPRRIPTPSSTSFPSGHSASAAAFAVAVGARLPAAAAPLGLLAAAVGYSRVHTGVHYPADVLAGFALGAASAGAVLLADRRRRVGPVHRPGAELQA